MEPLNLGVNFRLSVACADSSEHRDHVSPLPSAWSLKQIKGLKFLFCYDYQPCCRRKEEKRQEKKLRKSNVFLAPISWSSLWVHCPPKYIKISTFTTPKVFSFFLFQFYFVPEMLAVFVCKKLPTKHWETKCCCSKILSIRTQFCPQLNKYNSLSS